MTLLAAGLALFGVLHLIPSVPPLRAGLVARMGERPYRGVFSLVALASLVMAVWGFSTAPFEPVYSSPSWGRHAALGEEPDHYTWWAQRGGARARNVGWRIDYVLASPEAMERVQGAFIWPDEYGSDHCPVGVDIDL